MIERSAVEAWYSRDAFHQEVASRVQPVASVMDIGCGIRPQQFFVPDHLICVEPCPEYVGILQKNLVGGSVQIIVAQASAALASQPDRSVDSVFLIDVIEHMDKSVGQQVLAECLRVARRQVVVFTPLGFMPQEAAADGGDGWNLHGGAWQEHKSGWLPEEFPGWDIVGCRDLHRESSTGNSLDAAQGAFYAIHNASLNGFEADADHQQQINAIREHLAPVLGLGTGSGLAGPVLGAGLRACQRTTELLMGHGHRRAVADILAEVDAERVVAVQEALPTYRQRVLCLGAALQGCADLPLREAALAERDAASAALAAQLAQQQAAISGAAANAAEREHRLLGAEADLASRAAVQTERDVGQVAMDMDLALRAALVGARDEDLAKREAAVVDLQAALESRAQELAVFEARITGSALGRLARMLRGRGG